MQYPSSYFESYISHNYYIQYTSKPKLERIYISQSTQVMEESSAKEKTLPPGFRFHPTDEELITCYLINKISDSSFTGRAITDIDLNKFEPWDLPGI